MFKRNIQAIFEKGMLPVLEVMFACVKTFPIGYSESFEGEARRNWEVIQIKLQAILYSPDYPEWLYSQRVAPLLREGLHFFLMNLEQAVDTCFALCYWISPLKMSVIDENLQVAMQEAMQKNGALLERLIDWLKTENYKDTKEAFIEDIALLEEKLFNIIPNSLELMDIREEYIVFAQLVYNIKGLRRCLIALAAMLPRMIMEDEK